METDIQCIGGRYKLERKMGFGSFGEVFLAHDVLSARDVMIKFESLSARQLFLEHECTVYRKISGIPHVCWFGTEGGSNVMVIDCLGQSLQELFVQCHFKFSVQTVRFLASQLPSNIVMGTEPQANIVYIIDFGLSKQYRDPSTYEHISPNMGLGLIGTATFASINSHLGLELGRRDDMESLTYTLIYFLRGSLPWQDLRYAKGIAKCKQQTMPRNLCHSLPAEFQIFLEYCRSLSFKDKPDYQYINNLFMEGFQNDTTCDWEVAGNKRDTLDQVVFRLCQGLHSEKHQREH
ncbi:casein kinase I [Lactarius quietus]|nr:casein kinase I [Lactarius quietus]